VNEIYPAPAFLEMAIDAGKPLALSSDAHVPEQLGHEYERALELLDSMGVKEIAVFEDRTRSMEPLG
jgi:histidinol-phosphatase (PHP family)